MAVTPRETVHAGIAVTPRALIPAISKSVGFDGVESVKGALVELESIGNDRIMWWVEKSCWAELSKTYN
jgi:hypothetical protein